MKATGLAYQMRVLFEDKIMRYYRDTFRGTYGTVQTEALDYLYEHEYARTQHVAEVLRIPKQHASKILQRLELDNMVRQEPDPSDRRATIYSLTEKGVAFMEEHLTASNRNFEEKFMTLDADERAKMEEAMETLVELLKKF